MICKKCQKEMPELGEFCPFCGAAKEQEERSVLEEAAAAEQVLEEVSETAELTGEEVAEGTAEGEQTAEENAEESADENAEEEEAPKKPRLKTWQWIALIAGSVVLLAVLVGAVLYGLGVDLRPRANDILYKDSYTVSDEKAIAAADTVVATVGNYALTNSELQIQYWGSTYSFISNYYYYLSTMGIDITQPFEDQPCMMREEQTWQHYFLENTIKSWQYYAVLASMAEAEGFVLDPEVQEYLDNMPEETAKIAEAYGYSSAVEWLQEDAGPGVTLEGYATYLSTYYYGSEYLNHCYEVMVPTDDEVNAYYAENEAEFIENGITPDIGLNSSVRHILIQPQGGTADEYGVMTYTDEEWDTAYAEAERILNEWKTGEATEESFAELANTYSTDPGSNTTGGLYTDVNIDASYVESFENWAIDASRTTGDTGIVETEYGYHIMYFVEGEDYCFKVAKEQLVADWIKEKISVAMEEYPLEVNYKKIVLGEMIFA